MELLAYYDIRLQRSLLLHIKLNLEFLSTHSDDARVVDSVKDVNSSLASSESVNEFRASA